jgi:putative membrane-bound dehydrogenase-like protein
MRISKFCGALLLAASLTTAVPPCATALEPGPLLSPKEALAKMTVPEGFAVDLLTAEPDVVQPIAFCWDERGRLWVVEGNTYPRRAGQPPTPRPDDDPHLDRLTEEERAGLFEGKDRVVIFSDEDGDGSYETRKVFLENLNLVSGIEVGFGGVYIGAAPYFLHVPLDASGDRPAGPPRVLADGFGWQDTHETLNSFVWGPDGWLYGCHGVFTQSQVRVCTGPAGARKRFPMNCAYWRWHPVRQEFELFAQGTSNPWGLDFNAKGQFFSEACVIPHFWHVIPGAYYLRQSNPLGHFNPYVYQNIDTIADHSHFAGKAHRQSPQDASDFGGGHAHCGLCIYDGLNFPASYRGRPLLGNIHGKRINQETLLPEGSGYRASHAPDFLHSNDFNFTAVTLKQAPDGSLVFSDWYDKQKCHSGTSELWDRSNGRLYRVKFSKGWTPWKPDADVWSAPSTLELQLQENGWLSRMARRCIAEAAAKAPVDPELVLRARNLIGSSLPSETRLRLMWWLNATNDSSGRQAWKERLRDSDADVRQWAVQLLAERGSVEETVLAEFERMAREDASPVVRLALASALQRIPGKSRWEIAAALAAHAEDANDHNLPQMIWYGVEPAVPEAPERALQLAKNSRLEVPAALVVRRLAEIRSDAVNSLLLGAVTGADSVKTAGFFLHPLADAMNGRFGIATPKEWSGAYDKLGRLVEDSSTAPESLKLLDSRSRLGAAFNDPKAWKELNSLAGDRSAPLERRQKALQTLTAGRPSELAPLLLTLLPDPELRLEALRAGASAGVPESATAGSLPAFFAAVLEQYPTFQPKEKTAAVLAFSGRLATASLLMDAVEAKRIPHADLPMFAARQIAGLQNEALTDRVEKLWGKVRSADSKEKTEAAAKEHARLKAILTPNYLKSADLKNGRLLFQSICGACHQMFGEGGKIGPDLTGSNRADVDYLLENVTNPSALIGRDYELHVFTLKDGRVASGMVRSEDDALITIQSIGSEERIRRADIRSEEKPGISMMPEGLFSALPKEQLRDLVSYLASSQQVSLTAEPLKNGGSYRIDGALEAEALKVLAAPGIATVQAMGGFPLGVWSGNAQIFWRGAKTGDVLKLEVPVKTSGKLRVRAVFSRAPDYGIIKVRMAGREMELGSIDLFGSKVTNTEALNLGFLEVKEPGGVVLEIELTGKNPAASDNKIGLDCLLLEPADGPAKVVSPPQPAAAAPKAPEPKAAPVKKKSIVMVAGKPSHGPGAHEHNAGVLLLAKCLRQGADAQVELKLHLGGGWPAQEELDRADSLVVYADGYAGHPILQENHLEQVGSMMKRGGGLVCIHWATEVPKEKGGAEFVQWLGGYCEPDWSVNPHWTADFSALPPHPISRGVKPFSTLDEWYFHMRFLDGMRGVTPVLSAIAPESTMSRPDGLRSGNPSVRKAVADRVPQTVAWAVERPDGGRGFGFTGGHFHSGWANNDQRRLMLNAILWTAKGIVPDSGVDSRVTPEDMAANLDPKGK